MLPQSEYIRRNPEEFPVQYSLTAASFLEKPAKKEKRAEDPQQYKYNITDRDL